MQKWTFIFECYDLHDEIHMQLITIPDPLLIPFITLMCRRAIMNVVPGPQTPTQGLKILSLSIPMLQLTSR
jgi:hypothetical protein